MVSGKTYKLLLVEPAEIVATGLKRLLAASGIFKILDSDLTDDPNTMIERVTTLDPDIVLVDPAVFGLLHRSAVRVTFPALQRVTLVAMCHALYDEEALREFDGVINIYDTSSQVIKKLQAAVEQNASTPQTENSELSEREREMLVSIARGMTNKEIADKYNLSIHTVISHRKNISRKTGIKTIAGLTVYALLNNIITEADL